MHWLLTASICSYCLGNTPCGVSFRAFASAFEICEDKDIFMTTSQTSFLTILTIPASLLLMSLPQGASTPCLWFGDALHSPWHAHSPTLRLFLKISFGRELLCETFPDHPPLMPLAPLPGYSLLHSFDACHTCAKVSHLLPCPRITAYGSPIPSGLRSYHSAIVLSTDRH